MMEQPDLTNYVDDLEDEIFSFLFTQSTYDYIQSLGKNQEAATILKTSIFDDYDNLNEVHLGILANDDGAAVLEAAYVCVPKERSKSNLFLSMDIPRNYPKIDGFQDWLSAELADALSHELQHSCDTTEVLTSNCISGEDKWKNLENLEGYYGCDAEVRGHVAGILGRARRTGQDPYDLLSFDMETIFMKATEKGFKEKELSPVLQNIYTKYAERMESLL